MKKNPFGWIVFVVLPVILTLIAWGSYACLGCIALIATIVRIPEKKLSYQASTIIIMVVNIAGLLWIIASKLFKIL